MQNTLILAKIEQIAFKKDCLKENDLKASNFFSTNPRTIKIVDYMKKDTAQREKATKMLDNGCNCNQLNKMNCYKKDFLLREATFLGGFFEIFLKLQKKFSK